MTQYEKYYKSKYNEQRLKAVAMLGGSCVGCGTNDRLEFDHIKNDRDGKKRCLSQMFLGEWSKIEKEIEKCQLLCRGCHAKKSIMERGWGTPKHGTLTRYIKSGCRCDECRLQGKIYNRKRYELRMGYS